MLAQPSTWRAPHGPFADWAAPTPQDCEAVTQRLAQLHGMPTRGVTGEATSLETMGCGGVPSILDALIRTILSQNTTQKNASAAMQNFVRSFGGDYGRVRRASQARVAASIACGGLGNVKAGRIKNLLASVVASHGAASLEHLRGLPDAAIKEALMQYDGVGPKTASCVLLFCLGRDSFAVDTHVWRISKKLGWVPPRATREQAHLHLDVRVPPHLHYPLHVLMVRHGKSCYACAAQGRPQRPPRGPCPL